MLVVIYILFEYSRSRYWPCLISRSIPHYSDMRGLCFAEFLTRLEAQHAVAGLTTASIGAAVEPPLAPSFSTVSAVLGFLPSSSLLISFPLLAFGLIFRHVEMPSAFQMVGAKNKQVRELWKELWENMDRLDATFLSTNPVVPRSLHLLAWNVLPLFRWQCCTRSGICEFICESTGWNDDLSSAVCRPTVLLSLLIVRARKAGSRQFWNFHKAEQGFLFCKNETRSNLSREYIVV